MEDLIQALWYLPRDLVSDGYDRALAMLNEALGGAMTIHEYPTGEQCWTWRIPEKWTCDQAYLETLDGRRIIDVANHPLHVVSYSLPFEGVVERDELLKHLHVHPWLDEAIPFMFKYYQRDWGLCLTRKQRDALDEPRYRNLRVGSASVPSSDGQ